MKQTLPAILIIIAGMLLLLANIDLFSMRNIIDNWWPVALIVTGLLMLWYNRQNYVWALFVLAAGVIVLLNNLGVTTIDFGDIILPAIIVTFGVSLLANSLNRPRPSKEADESISAFLGGTSNKNTSNDYHGSKLTAVMGGVELDLSSATIKKEASLEVFVLMGGIDLRVPENVIVKNRASVMMGGVEDKTKPTESKNNPVLYIHGNVLLGGVEIKR